MIASACLIAGGCSHVDYRREMRSLVAEIGRAAKARRGDFAVIPQNGVTLLTRTGLGDGPAVDDYLAAIDGVGQESLYFGSHTPTRATAPEETRFLHYFLDLARERGLKVLVTDYPADRAQAEASYRLNKERGYLSIAASRELDAIAAYPASPPGTHSADVASLREARNYLYLLNPGRFKDRDAYLTSLRRTRYDLLIIDAFYEGSPLTREEVASLKIKAGGGRRLVVSYMSIGEAEDYRYYWRPGFKLSPPRWLAAENPDWKGNFKVRYWDPGWKKIILGPGGYLDRLLEAGFDGVYLDVVDAFEYFEERG